jgi:hypothetical protein
MASGNPPAILVFETNGDDQLGIGWIVMGLVPLASLDLCLRDVWILDRISKFVARLALRIDILLSRLFRSIF